MRPSLITLAVLASAVAPSLVLGGTAMGRLMFCCEPNNDLYRVVGGPQARSDTPAEAVANAPEGGAVLILASGYPDRTTALEPGLLEQAAERRLRLYVEYPAEVPGRAVGAPQTTQWERGVVASDWFGPDLPARRILAIHDCRYVPVAAPAPHLAVARVAGFDTAVYGLPESAQPILFELPGREVLVATTKLSQFVTARYAPTADWRVIWQRILGWLTRGEAPVALDWTPTVRPACGPDEPLPDRAEAHAARRGADWFRQSGLLATESLGRELAEGVTLAPKLRGDGSHGIREGIGSGIRWDGSQEVLGTKRSDCNGESAMALAFEAVRGGDARSGESAANILDYWYTRTIAQQAVRADPSHPCFGLVAWGISDWLWEKAYYGDDNARLLLGTIAAGSLLQTDRWDDATLRCLLANLRTTGRNGFRADRIDLENLEANGWRHYYEAATVSYAPHYQAYLWACYLWAYRATGYELFLERAEKAIGMTMAAYPDHWRWTNGIAQEKARMLLPLAWLVRLRDTPEHRGWLRRIATDLLALQEPCGAIREQLGKPGLGAYGPPQSNEAYGTNEATLMQEDGDPVCDLLYTTNFAFIGLHEAAAATGESLYTGAEDKLADFLCRIQVRSDSHPELDGGWFRGFDFRRWEYWGSSADAGWGVWCIESGWTQGWIASVFALREIGTSFWELTADHDLTGRLAALQPVFFPEGDALATGQPVSHLALGKPVTLREPFSPNYASMGAEALTDGLRATADHMDSAWLGFEGADLEATVDLGEIAAVNFVRAGFLQNIQWGIFLPSRVECLVSRDGREFHHAAGADTTTPPDKDGTFIEELALSLPDRTLTRYVRLRAKSLGTIPAWHHASGKRAWLFVDEVVVD